MTTTEFATERRQRLVDTHGYNGLALLTLYDGWRYFEPAGFDGFVAFELHRKTAVACGDPVCSEADLPALMTQFSEYCESRGWRFTFVGASARVGKAAHDLGFSAVKVGEEPFFDLENYSLSGKGAKKIRSATNLARRSGITVEEYTTRSPAIDSEVDEIAREWLASRKSAPMGFLLRSRPFAKREKKRIFIASFEGRVVAAMTCSPAPARNMLYIEEQLRRPDAPYGTTELLVEEARVAAKADGFSLMSLGTSPLQGAAVQPYGNFRSVKLLVRALFSRANVIYSFRSLNHYKKKFAPTFWEDTFFIYSGSFGAATVALAAAFSPDGLPSLVLPKRMQWLRVVPAAALWTAAFAGVLGTGFSAYEFPILTLPVRESFELLSLVRFPAGFMVNRTEGTLFAHRVISTLVVVVVGAAVWQRRARA